MKKQGKIIMGLVIAAALGLTGYNVYLSANNHHETPKVAKTQKKTTAKATGNQASTIKATATTELTPNQKLALAMVKSGNRFDGVSRVTAYRGDNQVTDAPTGYAVYTLDQQIDGKTAIVYVNGDVIGFTTTQSAVPYQYLKTNNLLWSAKAVYEQLQNNSEFKRLNQVITISNEGESDAQSSQVNTRDLTTQQVKQWVLSDYYSRSDGPMSEEDTAKIHTQTTHKAGLVYVDVLYDNGSSLHREASYRINEQGELENQDIASGDWEFASDTPPTN